MEQENFELVINPGSGWNGANFLLSLSHPGDEFRRYTIISHHKTEVEAEEAREKIFRDLIRQASGVAVV